MPSGSVRDVLGRPACCTGCLTLVVLCVVALLDPFHVVLGLRWGRDPFDPATWQANSQASYEAQRRAPRSIPEGRCSTPCCVSIGWPA